MRGWTILHGAKAILVALFIAISFYGKSQATEKLGAWYIYNGFFNFSPKFELFFETQLRNYEVFSNPESYFIKPYYSYNINKNWQVGFSTEFHKSFSYNTNPDLKNEGSEFRLALQGIYKHKWGLVFMQHRGRYEFRDQSTEHTQRARYRLQATLPLNKGELEKGAFFVNANNEIMLTTAPQFEFNQNRLFAACGYYFTKSLNFQLGYMMITQPNGIEHRLQFFLTQKLNFFTE